MGSFNRADAKLLAELPWDTDIVIKRQDLRDPVTPDVDMEVS